MTIAAAVIEQDAKFFLKQTGNSGLKQDFKRLSDSVGSNINSIMSRFNAEGQQQIRTHASADKVASIHNILSRLATMDDADVAKLEDDIISLTKIEEA